MEAETLEQTEARHHKEQRDLVGRITSKKKNATKKTRKGVNEECAQLEKRLTEKQEAELVALTGGVNDAQDDEIANDESIKHEVELLAEKLQRAIASEVRPTEPEADPAHTQIPSQTGGLAKKRNRQKERMARRAAEQEAAASKAEEDAKSMTDHRDLEKTYMLKQFKAHSRAEHEISPDGHCLFSAVADQLQQMGIALAPEIAPYKVLRRRAADWMAGHPDDFAPFLEEELETHVAKIRDTAEWGGMLELVALANAYGVNIRIVQDGRIEKIGPNTPEAGDDMKRQEVWLAYYRHGYGLGEHYNSLRKAE